MKKMYFVVIIITLFAINTSLFTENFYFSTRSTFANAQFWERQYNIDNTDKARKIFTNYFTGSFGIGIEMIIWDIGKKRGSRLFFKHGIDMTFSGLSFIGGYKEYEAGTFYSYNMNGGAFYLGLDWDFFIGGTFPKTDLIWGFGAIFNFMFPTYSPVIPAGSFHEKFSFYAVPSILLGYDIFIPNTNYKLTPQIRLGFTCNPVVPDDLLGTTEGRDMKTVGGKYVQDYLYSGLYIDVSLAFSFYTFKWKE